MDLREIHNKLKKEKKDTLVYEFGRVLNLLAHYDKKPLSKFAEGWAESRVAIIEVLNLRRFL